LWVAAIALFVTSTAVGQQAADVFRQSCAGCHTIDGGRLTGPDLKNVSTRRERGWLIRFIQNPSAVIQSGDAYATKLVDEADGRVMPSIGVNHVLAESLLDLIEHESRMPRSQFSGRRPEQPTTTPDRVLVGRMLFTGTRGLANGGTSCISCHTVREFGAIAGGHIAPDLTLTYERMGRSGLTQWLNNPPSTTMGPIFHSKPLQPEEIGALVAFLEATSKSGRQSVLGLAGGMLIMCAVVLFRKSW
jgi:mono/diheme cytochrome c family protein